MVQFSIGDDTERVRLLLVAEAPPTAPNRYFYFEQVKAQDSLFRYVVSTVLQVAPDRDRKVEQLELLKARGVYLVDLKMSPKRPGEDLTPFVPDLVARSLALKPDDVITVKANVCDLCQVPLRRSGLNVAHQKIPFPGSGQQLRFVESMNEALTSIGWKP